MNIELNLETKTDYQEVECITREAFWNLHFPGCDEHYLVHKMRSHKDFIQELDFIASVDGKIVGNIMNTKAKLVSASGNEIPVLTFGPISVLPEYQRKGIGRKLIDKTIENLHNDEYTAIVIWGNQKNYVKYGFKNCKEFNVSVMENKYPTCLLVLELKQGILGKEFYRYQESSVFKIDEKKAEQYDKKFERKEKMFNPTQEEFKILSHSYYE